MIDMHYLIIMTKGYVGNFGEYMRNTYEYNVRLKQRGKLLEGIHNFLAGTSKQAQIFSLA